MPQYSPISVYLCIYLSACTYASYLPDTCVLQWSAGGLPVTEGDEACWWGFKSELGQVLLSSILEVVFFNHMSGISIYVSS